MRSRRRPGCMHPATVALLPGERRAVAAALEGAFTHLDRARAAAKAMLAEGALGYGTDAARALADLRAAYRAAPTRADVCGDDAWSVSEAAWFAAAARAGEAAGALLAACARVAAARERACREPVALDDGCDAVFP